MVRRVYWWIINYSICKVWLLSLQHLEKYLQTNRSLEWKLWKQASVVSIFKMERLPLGIIIALSPFSIPFEKYLKWSYVITFHNHLKFIFNSSHHELIKSNITTTILLLVLTSLLPWLITSVRLKPFISILATLSI
jgi:hypothetical protein